MDLFNILKGSYGGCCALCSVEHGATGKILTLNSIDYAVCVDCGYLSSELKEHTVDEVRSKVIAVIDGIRDNFGFVIAKRFGVVGDAKTDVIFHFESYFDKAVDLETKIKRNDLRDQTHKHVYTMCRFMKHGAHWFFWCFDGKRWIEARDHSKDSLVMESEL